MNGLLATFMRLRGLKRRTPSWHAFTTAVENCLVIRTVLAQTMSGAVMTAAVLKPVRLLF